ncbi:MAG: glutamate synthase-related protein [Candidatus Izemoplasmatales bacterium]
MSKKKPIISTVKNGPLVIENLSDLTQSTKRKTKIDARAISLCRCGQSKSKPYCDGTHGKIGFTDEKEEDRVPRNEKTYEGKEVTIHDDRGICSHAGYCTDGLPKVFNMDKDPWIDPNGASKKEIIETIEKCPSGALSYKIDGVLYNAYHKDPELEITEDGHYRVRGFIKLNDDDQPQSQEHYALCRCGESKNKPFCDGSHWYEKFKDNGLASKKERIFKENTKVPYDNKFDYIKSLANDGQIEYASMRTLELFPDFKYLLFKAAQLDRMPLNKDVQINLETVIGKTAKKPLKLGLPYYVSHMSFGAISKEAKIALAKGSAASNTAMCSGEGGMVEESFENAKYYIYEQGTAEFTYNEEAMKKAAAVEIKIGQGVKPGLGGHLPAKKVTKEIAKTRGLNENEDSEAPNRLHSMDSLDDLSKRVQQIRKIIDGKPVGIKIATGYLEEDLKAALSAKPDFITIDCRGGATGSSPKFLKDSVGIPAIYAIRRARIYLDKVGSEVTLCATGGFRDSTDIAKGLALGADAIALATASLIGIGCMQSRVCHTGKCPVGIATQDEHLRALLDVDESAKKLENYFKTMAKELEILSRSHGIKNIHDLCANDLMTISNEISQNTDIHHV